MEATVSDERPSQEGPATFREVFAQREYRAVFAASGLSWIGDFIAKAAVTVLVYRETESVAYSAAAFAVSFLPWLIGGPLLATLAERHRYRSVMVACDLIRMALMVLVAIPWNPPWLILCLLFATTLANPPSQAARSALMPLILTGDRLVVGLSLNSSTGQAAQVIGYLIGAAIAAVNPTAALLINAGTFALSATLVRFGVRDRPPAMSAAHRSHLLRETADGFRIVFGTPVLRAVALLVFSSMLFSIVPEGLAAAWAREGAGGGLDTGASQAAIMAANPIGFILGGLLVGRAVAPARRLLLIRPLAVLAPLALVPALLDPPPLVVALLAALCGFAVAGLLPVANGLFVRALPNGFRARAFGVMATGVQVIQGAAVLITGLLAERFSIPLVVGVWSAAGVLLMLLTAARWPSRAAIDAAVEAAGNEAGPGLPRPAGRGDGKGEGQLDNLPGEHSRRSHAVG
ncbi:MFS transporter [Micromonospora sp. NBC_01405]|uniref:MFS transporter n=1 Tax=Micromonospora sp. NBC_01405 TaxID=2903589 RepID=UPI003247FE45